MKLKIWITMLGLAAATLLSACGSDDEDPPADRVTTILGLTGDSATGMTAFTQNGCGNMACHGADGDSGSAADLSARVPARTDTQLVTSLVNGLDGGMPAYTQRPDQEIADLLAYLNATFGS